MPLLYLCWLCSPVFSTVHARFLNTTAEPNSTKIHYYFICNVQGPTLQWGFQNYTKGFNPGQFSSQPSIIERGEYGIVSVLLPSQRSNGTEIMASALIIRTLVHTNLTVHCSDGLMTSTTNNTGSIQNVSDTEQIDNITLNREMSAKAINTATYQTSFFVCVTQDSSYQDLNINNEHNVSVEPSSPFYYENSLWNTSIISYVAVVLDHSGRSITTLLVVNEMPDVIITCSSEKGSVKLQYSQTAIIRKTPSVSTSKTSIHETPTYSGTQIILETPRTQTPDRNKCIKLICVILVIVLLATVIISGITVVLLLCLHFQRLVHIIAFCLHCNI